MIGSVAASIGQSIFANYVYGRLFCKSEPDFSLSAYVPLPMSTYEKIDIVVEDYIKTLSRRAEANNRIALARTALFLEDEKREQSVARLLDAVLFDEVSAIKEIQKLLRDHAEANTLYGDYLEGERVQATAEQIVKELSESIYTRIPSVQRVVALIKSAEHATSKKESSSAEQQPICSSELPKTISWHVKKSIRRCESIMVSGFDAFIKSDTYNNDIRKSFVSLEASNSRGNRNERMAAENVLKKERLVSLRGSAGSGKTTLLQWLVVNYDWADPKCPLPILIQLRHIVASGVERFSAEKIFDSICIDRKSAEELTRAIHGDIDVGKELHLLLDGLDEVPFESRKDFWRFVEELIERNAQLRITVTSRNLYYTHDAFGNFKDPLEMSASEFSASRSEWCPPDGFVDFTLVGLDRSDIGTFIDKWHEGVDESKIHEGLTSNIEQASMSLKQHLETGDNGEDLIELCSNPMLCALLCLVNLVERGRLPENPRNLYKAAVKILILSRDELRGIVTDPRLDELSLELRQNILEFIAFSFQESIKGSNQYNVEVAKDVVLDWVSFYVENVAEDDLLVSPEELFSFVVERLSVIREPSTGVVDFVHRTFMEYLAAEHFVRSKPATLVRSYCFQDQWHGTLKFLANSESGGQAFNAMLLDEVLSVLLMPDTPSSFRNLCLDILEYLSSIPQGEPSTLTQILELLRPFREDEAKKICRLPFSLISDVFLTNWETGENLEKVTAETAIVLAVHKSKRSKKVLQGHLGYLKSSVFCTMLNFQRVLPFKEQVGLIHLLNEKAFFQGPLKNEVVRVFCDDIADVVEALPRDGGRRDVIDFLHVGPTTKNLVKSRHLQGVCALVIESSFSTTKERMERDIGKAFDGEVITSATFVL